MYALAYCCNRNTDRVLNVATSVHVQMKNVLKKWDSPCMIMPSCLNLSVTR